MSSQPVLDYSELQLKELSGPDMTNAPERKTTRIDFGRVIMVPFCALVVFLNAFVIYRGYRAMERLDVLDVLAQINAILVTGFYVMMTSVYLLRSPAKRTSSSFIVNVIAMITTFLMVPLLVITGTQRSGMFLMSLGAVIATLGLGFSVYSLFKLGRSFSIIPQARGFVQSGPYKYLRHPLYLGEIITVSGFVLSHLMISTVAILLLVIVMQAYRALREEGILASTFPEYHKYMSRTWRFVPYIF
jgi:protein-S-isoprenylcysteine O-methyltransferase Ste14